MEEENQLTEEASITPDNKVVIETAEETTKPTEETPPPIAEKQDETVKSAADTLEEPQKEDPPPSNPPQADPPQEDPPQADPPQANPPQTDALEASSSTSTVSSIVSQHDKKESIVDAGAHQGHEKPPPPMLVDPPPTVDNNNFGEIDICQLVDMLAPAPPMLVYIPLVQSPFQAIDFYPVCTRPGNKTRKQDPQFGPFSTLVSQANHWLMSHPQYKVVRCESVTRACDIKGQVNHSISHRHEAAFGMRIFARILRLWVQFDPLQTHPVNIWYFNVFPKYTGRDGDDMLEGVTNTLSHINKMLLLRPLPGRILNVEHLLVDLENLRGDKVDMEKNCWSTFSGSSYRFAITYRVFYIPSLPTNQSIGIVTFLPDMQIISGKSKVEFSQMDKTLANAMNWILANKQHRVTDIQTVVMTDRVRTQSVDSILPALPQLNVDASVLIENFLQDTNHIKSLRIVFVANEGSTLTQPCISTHLFAPCKCGSMTYESIQDSIWRMGEWLKASQSRVLLVESVDIDHVANWDVVHSTYMNYEMIPGKGRPKLSCFRVYFDGMVRVPASSELPPPPMIKSSMCNIL